MALGPSGIKTFQKECNIVSGVVEIAFAIILPQDIVSTTVSC